MKKLNKRQLEAELQSELFNRLNGLSKEERTLTRAELLINPIECTYYNYCDKYKVTIVDFARNGRQIILSNGERLNYNPKSQNPKYKGEYCVLILRESVNYRNLER